MERLKQWLAGRNIRIGRPKVAPDGLISLRLHPPFGAAFEVDFYPDDLEADPENAIASIEGYLSKRRIML